MNPKLYKTEKIKSGRPRCPFRECAVRAGVARYLDASGKERWACSGNLIRDKLLWETNKRRAAGVEPQKSKAPPDVLSKRNVANVQRWRDKNPDKLKAQRVKGNFIRRSAVRGRIMEPVTSDFLIEQKARQHDLCAYCGTPLFGGGHQDHIIPVSKGGARAPFNIVWSCEPCNLRKGAKLGWVPLWGGKGCVNEGR